VKKNAERFARSDLDFSDCEKERTQYQYVFSRLRPRPVLCTRTEKLLRKDFLFFFLFYFLLGLDNMDFYYLIQIKID